MFPQTIVLASGEQLTIRPPAPHELPALFAFVAEIHESPALGAWAHDALSGRHPEMTPDSALVAVAADGQLAASVVLIPQQWRYGTVTLPVTQLEAIGVAPAYRHQGLARTLLAAAERLARQHGQLLQAIIGPPNLYRRFGYSYAVRFRGGRTLAADAVPPTGSATARPATLHDIPALQRLDAAANSRLLLRRAISAARWAYDLVGHSPDSDAALQLDLVLDQQGAPLAYARSFPMPWDGELVVVELALGAGDPAEVAQALVATWRAQHGDALAQVVWELDEAHPLFAALDAQLSPPRRPSAWYLRAPDLPALLARLAPALWKAFAAAGDPPAPTMLALSTYGGGLALELSTTSLTVAPWAGAWHEADAALPPEALLMLVTGYRSLDTLVEQFPDVLASSEAAALLRRLFPPRPSHVLPLG